MQGNTRTMKQQIATFDLNDEGAIRAYVECECMENSHQLTIDFWPGKTPDETDYVVSLAWYRDRPSFLERVRFAWSVLTGHAQYNAQDTIWTVEKAQAVADFINKCNAQVNTTP